MTAVVEPSINITCRIFRLTTMCYNRRHNHHHHHHHHEISNCESSKMSLAVVKNVVVPGRQEENDDSSSPDEYDFTSTRRKRPRTNYRSILAVHSSRVSPTNNRNKRPRRANITSSRRLSVTFNGIHQSSKSSIHSFSEDEKKDLWYSLDDCIKMNEDLKREVQVSRSNHVDKVRHMMCVFSQCSYSKPNMVYLDTVRLVLPDKCRGLERMMIPHHHRRNKQEHVREVIDTQQIISDWYNLGQQQHRKQITSIEEKSGGGIEENKDGISKHENGNIFFPEETKNSISNNPFRDEMEECKQGKSLPSSSGPLRCMMVNSCKKLDLILAARARRSSQSSRLFAQLLGREVASSVTTREDRS